MSIEDDGVGMPAETASKGLGQTVIASLLRSMRATLNTEPAHPEQAGRTGTRVTIVFPKREALPAQA